jgi:predicted RecA/RadA family phage recombinase
MSSTASAFGWRSAAQCHGALPRRARAGETPQGLLYSAASRSIEGAPAVDRDKNEGLFELGDVELGRSVDIARAGVVRAPIAHGQELPIGARVEWSTGHREFARTVTVKSAAAFPSEPDAGLPDGRPQRRHRSRPRRARAASATR